MGRNIPNLFIASLERSFYTAKMRKIEKTRQRKTARHMQAGVHCDKLAAFYRSHRRMPSYAELQKLWGYRTKSAVHYALQKLILDGVLSRDAHGRLIPRNLYGEVSVLGVVEAGFPTAAEEEL